MHKQIEISKGELEELQRASLTIEKILGAGMARFDEPELPTVKGCNGCSGSCSGTCGGSCAGSCRGGCKGTCNALCSTVCTMLGS